MYADVTFKNPVLQRVNEILEYLEMNFGMVYAHKYDQQLMCSEEAVRTIAAELEDDDDVATLAAALGLSVGEQEKCEQ